MSMRILWFTNTMSCYTPQGSFSAHGYNGGGWIASAEKMMRGQKGIKLAVAFMAEGQPIKVEQNGVIYYPISADNSSTIKKLRLLIGDNEIFEKSTWSYYLDHFKRIVDDFNPDIVHVWGSEQYFGLVWKVTDKPVVLHIQGIIGPYVNAYMPAGMSWTDMRRETWNPIKRIRCLYHEKSWCNSAYREQEIFNGLTATFGRTLWDKSVAHCLNPNIPYYHVDEILRDEFYKETERLLPERLTIVTTISSPPYKGFDLVLKTAKILKCNLGLDFVWKCYGNIFSKQMEKFTGICHKNVNVELCGVATSAELQKAELSASMYFHPSYIDNSPNSLCEAQMLGIPVICTNAGGMPSLVTDGEDGYIVPTNDPYQSACCIERLAKSINLNIDMGKKAKMKAQERHSTERVTKQIMDIYKNLAGHE